MPRFAANLTMLFTDYPMVERIDRAAEAGFSGIEFLFPYQEDVDGIQEALKRNGIQQVLFNLPAGDFAGGERGIANNPDRTQEFRDGVQKALEIAAKLDCPKLNCLSGLALDGVPWETQWNTLIENYQHAAEETAKAGVLQLVEPINTFDMPGFTVPTTNHGLKLINAVGHQNLKLQYDVYHMQRMEGDVIATIREYAPHFGHVQIADPPSRTQPGTGEVAFERVLDALVDSGYAGYIGLEYKPTPGLDPFAWLQTLGQGQG